ncbi:ISAs1 family transposase [Cyanobacteria bacterium FACHB-63]|nr:ISAs1 family transposase [Cyanobacteria bacterium FACHB-63]
MSLIEPLKQVRDYRTQPRYELWVVLLLVIMGTMSGCTGYRALAEFVERHQPQLLEVLELDYKRLPSYSTIRQVLVRLNFEALTNAFNAWTQAEIHIQPCEQIAIDGKSIKASVEEYDSRYQDFVNIVSAFCTRTGVVVGVAPMHTQQGSEIETVLRLLSALHLKGVCFSLDALHTQKNSRANH